MLAFSDMMFWSPGEGGGVSEGSGGVRGGFSGAGGVREKGVEVLVEMEGVRGMGGGFSELVN